MAKVRVLSKFHDVNNYAIVYEVGQVVDFMDEKRVRSIVERGIGEIVEEHIGATEVQDEMPSSEVAEAPKQEKRTTKRSRK